MQLQELLARLSYGELSNLSIGNEGRGSINEEQIPKVVNHVNDGLLRIFSRFLLDQKILMLETREHITNYHLIRRFAESADEQVKYPYIKDMHCDPFTGDLIKVIEVFDQFGNEYPLNDKGNGRSLFTPAPEILQVPNPKDGLSFSISYQARHPLLNNEDLEQEINIPFVLEGALQSFVAYKIFSHMNGQEHMVKSQEHLNTYDSICVDVEARDLVNGTFATSHHKLEERGFI